MVIRTGPNSPHDKFSKWIVTQRSQGGALPDGYRVFKAAVWRVDQFESEEKIREGEKPLAMPNEEDFMAFLGWSPIDEWYKPSNRHADWGRYTR